MKKAITVLALITGTIANAQNWGWAKSAISGGMDKITGLNTDSNGNILITGNYNGNSINFDGTSLLNTSSMSGNAVFTAKYSSSGSVMWVKQATTAGCCATSSVITSDNLNNVYVTGTSAFDIYFENYTLQQEIFLTKYDTQGNILWAISAYNNLAPFGFVPTCTDIKTDLSGNVYVTGYFSDAQAIFGTDTLNNANPTTNKKDVFIAKFDSNGNFIWVKSFGGILDDYSTSLAIDNAGNIFIGGYFYSSSITFDTTILTNQGGADIFYAKLDINGNVTWAKNAGGTFDDLANDLALDNNNNIFLTGSFTGGTIIGTNTLNSIGSKDYFIAKFDLNGINLWAKSGISTNPDEGISITTDNGGNSYIAGKFSVDSAIIKYNSIGTLQWIKSVGNSQVFIKTGITFKNGNVYLVGYFGTPTLSFDNINLVNSGTGFDIVLASLNNVTSLNNIDNNTNIRIFPNPFYDKTTIQFENNNDIKYELYLYDVLGNELRKYEIKNHSFEISKENLTSGLYFFKIKDSQEIIASGKLIIQ
jgi:hypothetical protein